MIRLDCPCCGGDIYVTLVQGDYPEDPYGWSIDEWEQECDCDLSHEQVHDIEAEAEEALP